MLRMLTLCLAATLFVPSGALALSNADLPLECHVVDGPAEVISARTDERVRELRERMALFAGLVEDARGFVARSRAIDTHVIRCPHFTDFYDLEGIYYVTLHFKPNTRNGVIVPEHAYTILVHPQVFASSDEFSLIQNARRQVCVVATHEESKDFGPIVFREAYPAAVLTCMRRLALRAQDDAHVAWLNHLLRQADPTQLRATPARRRAVRARNTPAQP